MFRIAAPSIGDFLDRSQGLQSSARVSRSLSSDVPCMACVRSNSSHCCALGAVVLQFKFGIPAPSREDDEILRKPCLSVCPVATGRQVDAPSCPEVCQRRRPCVHLYLYFVFSPASEAHLSVEYSLHRRVCWLQLFGIVDSLPSCPLQVSV